MLECVANRRLNVERFLPPLPVSVSMPATVPIVKSTVVPLVVRTTASVPAPPLRDSPAMKSPVATLNVSLPLPATIVRYYAVRCT